MDPFEVRTRQRNEFVEITDRVAQALARHRMPQGWFITGVVRPRTH